MSITAQLDATTADPAGSAVHGSDDEQQPELYTTGHEGVHIQVFVAVVGRARMMGIVSVNVEHPVAA